MSTDSDRDLLEKAAKAAGIPAVWNEACAAMVMPDPEKTLTRRSGDRVLWAPLTDLADAASLAFRLRLPVDYVGDQPMVNGILCSGMSAEESFCKAVVRAAASMAQQEPNT